MEKQRIWELDAMRGVLILLVAAVHGIYDAVNLYGLLDWEFPPLYLGITAFGACLFPWMSGVAVTLGRHSVRRGLTVFAGGMIITAVTVGMYLLDFAGADIIIYFGVLHCLGVCMLLWPLLGRLSVPKMAVLGTVLAAAGILIGYFRVSAHTWLLIPLGIVPPEFASSDYFPLMPHLGFFLLGAVLGRTLYKEKTTRFPRVPVSSPAVRFFCACGKNSLLIYLLHQPVLAAVFELIVYFRS